MALATVAVAANATTISQANVTDLRRWTGPTVGVWSTASRPTTPLSFGHNTTLNRWEFTLNGSTWQPVGYVDLGTAQVTGTLPPANGGTGVTSLNALRSALGLGTATNVPVPVASGGTGGTDRDTARQNGVDLWLQPASPTHAAGRLWLKTP